MQPMIDLNEVTFEYPGLRALDRVTCHIEGGTTTALVGPNGAGKTTLMRCLCGLEQPLAGDIVVDGINVIEEPRRSHQRLGYLSDFFGLYEDLTVAQCLRYAALANGLREGLDARVQSAAGQLGLADRLTDRAGTLSRGLRQRVAIAQALIHEPRVLVLDEPAAGLDPTARHALAELFRGLQARGMTLLVSSHILTELEQYATHMMVLEGGRMIEYRALANAAGPTRSLALDFLGEAASLAQFLRLRPEISQLTISGGRALFELTGDDPAQAALLRDLVSSGISVTAFGPVRGDLQERYLATLNHRRGLS